MHLRHPKPADPSWLRGSCYSHCTTLLIFYASRWLGTIFSSRQHACAHPKQKSPFWVLFVHVQSWGGWGVRPIIWMLHATDHTWASCTHTLVHCHWSGTMSVIATQPLPPTWTSQEAGTAWCSNQQMRIVYSKSLNWFPIRYFLVKTPHWLRIHLQFIPFTDSYSYWWNIHSSCILYSCRTAFNTLDTQGWTPTCGWYGMWLSARFLDIFDMKVFTSTCTCKALTPFTHSEVVAHTYIICLSTEMCSSSTWSRSTHSNSSNSVHLCTA